MSLTLRKLKNTRFEALYRKLLLRKSLSRNEATCLLSVAVILLRQEDVLLRDLGYKIVLAYSLHTDQYAPLYDVSLALGYTAIAEALRSGGRVGCGYGSMASLEVDALYLEMCTRDGKCFTAGQGRLRKFNSDLSIRDGVIIAPTSYGKSEAICDLLKIDLLRSVCIVVPTKSLIAQTREMVGGCLGCNQAKVITHPNVEYSADGRNVFILTQERLLRLLSEDRSLSFDCLVVDEAHNLLEKEERAQLLADVIVLAKKRNSEAVVRYLTPFLFSVESLRLRLLPSTLQDCKISESLKMVRVMLFENGHLRQYDQFYDKYYEVDGLYEGPIDLELSRGSEKNIVYINRPFAVERHAAALSERSERVTSDLIERFCQDLSNFTHPSYNLVKYARKGVLYHHGSMPEAIRRGVEYLFARETRCRFLVTTSTLLEGVNLPATRMFILDNRKGRGNLSPSAFRNLIGRVCRFGEIFGSRQRLSLLQPEVYVVRSEYMAINANLERFVSGVYRADRRHKDKVENPALSGANSKDEVPFLRLQEHIENFEPGTIEGYAGRRTRTEIGRLCISNSVLDFDVIDKEDLISARLSKIVIPINDVEGLVGAISEIFITETDDDNLRRLLEAEAIRFYAMFIGWRMENAPLPRMIANFVRYWLERANKAEGRYVYVGSKWGEEKRGGHKELWVDVSKKSRDELVNLAIVRIHEEQEFVDNRILKYVDVLHDYGVVDDALWKGVRYGTTDESTIRLLDNGMSYGLIALLSDRYQMSINQLVKEPYLPAAVYEEMKRNRENIFILLEAKAFVRDA